MRILLTKVTLFCLIIFSLACGKSRRVVNDSTTPERRGNTLESVESNFIEKSPSMSADGTKLAFLTGKGSESTFQIYTLDWDVGSEPGEATAWAADIDDLGILTDVSMSPDGTMLAFKSYKTDDSDSSAAIDLYVSDVDTPDPTAIQRSTEFSLVERIGDDYHFSSDSKMLLWNGYVQTNDAFQKVINVSNISDLSNQSTVSLSTENLGEGEFEFQQAFWLEPEAGNYRIMVTIVNSTSYIPNWYVYSFSSISDIESVTPTLFIEATSFKTTPALSPKVSGQSIMIAQVPDSEVSINNSGDFSECPEDHTCTVPAQEIPLVVDMDQAALQSVESLPGYDLLKSQIYSDGFVWLARNAYRCETDPKAKSRGTAIILTDESGSPLAASNSSSILRRSSSGQWDVAEGFCDLTLEDQSLGVLDFQTIDFEVPTNISSNNFRVVLVTRATTAYDADCQLKAGDPELRAIEFDGETSSVYDLFENSKVIEDSAREEPCDSQ